MPTETATTTKHEVKVGDFFYASWGYDQTNINFFKVVGLTPKCVKIQEWTHEMFSDADGPAEYVVPGLGGPRRGCWVHDKDGSSHYDRDREYPVMTKRLCRYGPSETPYLAWKSYASLSYWDCAPKYQTAAGYGH